MVSSIASGNLDTILATKAFKRPSTTEARVVDQQVNGKPEFGDPLEEPLRRIGFGQVQRRRR